MVAGDARDRPLGPHHAPRMTHDRKPDAAPPADRRPRPILERLGLAFIALVLASLFGAVAAAAWTGGELFLAAMGAIGCGMTLWAGALTLFRG